jgi:mRNA interferase MazF
MRRSRGDIWFVDLTDARGHEQSGTPARRGARRRLRRHDDRGPAHDDPGGLFGFPHTHGIEKSSQNGLSSDSAALVFQIVALSQDRFVRKIGRCSTEDMEAISVLLKDLLSLE